MNLRPPVLAAAFVAIGLQACDGAGSMLAAHEPVPERFRSNGERIYFTGTSASGSLIVYEGGGMHTHMMGGTCAACHGADRNGRRMLPEFWTAAPPLTREALFGDGEHGHDDHSHYDDRTLWRAVSRGVGPAGEALHGSMPRWSMTQEDWRDLLAYLHR